jgi:predicted nucleotidyltransferase component of viral defense system
MQDLLSVLDYAQKNNYPVSNKKGIYVEYLQHEILKSLFSHTDKISFIGGTCLRIVFKLPRFSEDLDFDNFGLSQKDFEELISKVTKDLELLGFDVEFRNVYKGAYHCYFKFADILHRYGLSPNDDEKILVRLDTVNQDFKFESEVAIINNFGIFAEIRHNPVDILLSQKFLTVLGRNRSKGRDFFDITHLMSKASPNLEYLKVKGDIDGLQDLKNKILQFCETVDFNDMYNDVKPFLFDPKDGERILKFKQYINTNLNTNQHES